MKGIQSLIGELLHAAIINTLIAYQCLLVALPAVF